jgi:O-antigen/teichoic acid export membrane protein
MWDLLARIAILLGIVEMVHRGAGIPALVGVVVGIPAITGVLNGLILFNFQLPWLRPSISAINLAAAEWILRKGALFFVLQVVIAITFTSDDLIIAQVFGPQAVGSYAVPRTLFQLVMLVVGLFLAPLWPAYSEAIAKGERLWVVATLKRSLWIAAMTSTLGAAVLILFAKMILRLWVGSDLHVSYWLLAGFAFWTIMSSFGNAIGMLMNAASIIRFQIVVAIPLAICAVAGKIAFAHWFGINGVIWGTVTAYGLISVLPCVIYIRHWLITEHAGLH